MKLDPKTHDYITVVVLIAFLFFAGAAATLYATGKPVPVELWAVVSTAFAGMCGLVLNKKDDTQ